MDANVTPFVQSHKEESGAFEIRTAGSHASAAADERKTLRNVYLVRKLQADGIS